jgi:hypothetical protein
MSYEHKKTSLPNFKGARNDKVWLNFVIFGPPNFVKNENEVSRLDAGRNQAQSDFWEIGLTKIIWNEIISHSYGFTSQIRYHLAKCRYPKG